MLRIPTFSYVSHSCTSYCYSFYRYVTLYIIPFYIAVLYHALLSFVMLCTEFYLLLRLLTFIIATRLFLPSSFRRSTRKEHSFPVI